MKLNQKILKAINEGIRKSLLSFDDVQFDQLNSNDVNQKIAQNIKTQDLLNNDFVDLGLPSGTLWMKYNLGATCEDSFKTWFGDYYAWGETDECNKQSYSWETYKWCTTEDSKKKWKEITKYVNMAADKSGKYKYGQPDGRLELEPSDDVVHKKFGGSFWMPSKEEVEELKSYTYHTNVCDYNGIKHLNGVIFTGDNGNTLFIPNGGRKTAECVTSMDYSFFWTRNTSEIPLYAFAFYYVGNINFTAVDNYAKREGLPIRAIYKNDIIHN